MKLLGMMVMEKGITLRELIVGLDPKPCPGRPLISCNGRYLKGTERQQVLTALYEQGIKAYREQFKFILTQESWLWKARDEP